MFFLYKKYLAYLWVFNCVTNVNLCIYYKKRALVHNKLWSLLTTNKNIKHLLIKDHAANKVLQYSKYLTLFGIKESAIKTSMYKYSTNFLFIRKLYFLNMFKYPMVEKSINSLDILKSNTVYFLLKNSKKKTEKDII